MSSLPSLSAFSVLASLYVVCASCITEACPIDAPNFTLASFSRLHGVGGAVCAVSGVRVARECGVRGWPGYLHIIGDWRAAGAAPMRAPRGPVSFHLNGEAFSQGRAGGVWAPARGGGERRGM